MCTSNRFPLGQDDMAQGRIQKYTPEKVDSYREALNHLLHPVFTSPEHDRYFATVLQSCIAKAAVTVFGCPGKPACPKVRQNWYYKECQVARASMKYLLPGTPEHSAESKAYKASLRRKRRVWQYQAQHSLRELASRTPRFLGNITRKGSERPTPSRAKHGRSPLKASTSLKMSPRRQLRSNLLPFPR